jgi:predicted membrane protein
MGDRVANTLSFTASTLLLIQVFAMRWNVVIGGQMISKSLAGLREAYHPDIFGREGILTAVAIMIVPFVFILVAEKLLPMFKFSEEQTRKANEPPAPSAPSVSPSYE